ncbi:hypothetical protein VP137E351_P0042 [Vibrio phage 137E35-1]|nr:hypothetical protein VP137E351_P0042 [Vibrio phage 137E35-1]CAH9016254.1 hypothetical protein VP230E391_P0042 [Vibrio phage 230E39-1]
MKRITKGKVYFAMLWLVWSFLVYWLGSYYQSMA